MKRENLSKVIPVRMTPTMYEQLSRVAKNKGLRTSGLIRLTCAGFVLSNNAKVLIEVEQLRILLGELVAAGDKFSQAHFADMAMGETVTDPQDWAEFDQAIEKAKEAIGE